MNPIGVGVFVYLLLGIEPVVRGVYGGSGAGGSGVMPYFVLPGVIFIAMFAPANLAWWTGLLSGLLVDLTTSYPSRAGAFGSASAASFMVIPGPAALGYLAATVFTTTIRGMMMKRSPFAMIFVCVVGSIVAQCVLVALLTVHSVFDRDMMSFGAGFGPTSRLWYGVECALLAGIPALAFALGARWLIPILGMTDATTRRMGR